ncbi:hypothetical protein Indivirus_1_107 [Indivirus ILV1]|uniref:Uncharacterized protein n=1 Tax=Indivirus ILV1 TaxID=1977633 RepID=A0A1V0SCX4_9VIRU|nr:hypothetical protein Indivirus_1_107 [Indivirus ILV1]
MSSICTPKKYIVELGINAILHIFILFLILSLFFRFYVSNVIKNALNNELENLINENVENAINKNLSETQKKELNKIASSESTERLHKYYDQENKIVATNNNWLFRDMFTITGILFVLTLLIIITSYLLCSGINISKLILENVLIFIGVGIVEFMFFTFVATKYSPAPPSLMVKSILENLNKSLTV